MRSTILIALAAAAALAAGPVLAQEDHNAHHSAPDPMPAAAAPAPGGMEGMSQADMHQMCMGVMGKDMAPRAVHEHSREKSGIAMWPNGKPLTKAEMEAMHSRCAEMMQGQHAAPAPK